MKNQTIFVNSWGGSGSTFLTHELNKKYNNINFIHSHCQNKPQNYLLKQQKNIYTGCEGDIISTKVKNNNKVIFILRDPNYVYQSRTCVQHFLNLNDSNNVITQLNFINKNKDFYDNNYKNIIENKENLIKNIECRKLYNNNDYNYYKLINKDTDYLNIEYFFNNWNYYNKNLHKYDVLFVKYESLYKKENQDIMYNFIDSNIKINDYIKYIPKTKVKNIKGLQNFSYNYNKIPDIFKNYYKFI